jgi:hypothetical protein
MDLVYFSGRGAWFLNARPRDLFGPRLSHNFVFKAPDTGEIESTDEFFRLYDGIDQMLCNEHVGIFKLTPKEAVIYSATKDLSHVEKLLPCDHPYSAFSIAVEEGHISKDAFDNCFFLIQKSLDKEYFEHRPMTITPYLLDNNLIPIEELDIKKTAIDPSKLLLNTDYKLEKSETTTTIATSTKEFDRNKMLVTILGMAMDKYGYKPTTPEKGVYSNLNARLLAHKILVSDEDISKCLTLASALFEMGAGYKTIRETKPEIEQSTLLKLIIGMAIDAYDYNPKLSRNKASGSNKRVSISGRLENNHKINVNKGTVQKYLTVARELLPLEAQ